MRDGSLSVSNYKLILWCDNVQRYLFAVNHILFDYYYYLHILVYVH